MSGFVIDLPINPVAWERPAGGGDRRRYTPPELDAFYSLFRGSLLSCRPRPKLPGLDEPLAVTMRLWRNARVSTGPSRGDIDNMEKAILDAGNQHLWTDDSHVEAVHKEIMAAGPTVEGRIWLRIQPRRHTADANAEYAAATARLAMLIDRQKLAPKSIAVHDQAASQIRGHMLAAGVDLDDPLVLRTFTSALDYVVAQSCVSPTGFVLGEVINTVVLAHRAA